MDYNYHEVKDGIEHILYGLGVDLEDPNFKDTPDRVARAYRELCRGLYERDKIDEILSRVFPSDNDQMIIRPDIDAVGLCPHHLLPVRYRVHVGYIPAEGGFVLGASKISRLVHLLAARPILQEDLAPDIVDKLEETLNPLGVMAVVIGEHSCMQCRGIKEASSKMITSAVRGIFKSEFDSPRAEFLSLVGKF